MTCLDTLDKLSNALRVEMNSFFEYSHKAKNKRELKKTINELLADTDEDKLTKVVKVLKALLR